MVPAAGEGNRPVPLIVPSAVFCAMYKCEAFWSWCFSGEMEDPLGKEALIDVTR